MVYRVFVEKKKELAFEAKSLLSDARTLLGIDNLTDVRLLNRYDVENITEELFDYSKKTVFSEPQLDIVTDNIDYLKDCVVFAVEYLPGQFDQRADSAAQCIQIISQGDRPTIRTARVYALYGNLSDADIAAVGHQAEHQQHQIHQHIQRAEGNGNHVVQTAHQGLEGVHTQRGDFEYTDADSANKHTRQGHENSSCFHS